MYKQFLLFPQCLRKASLLEASKGVNVGEWVKHVLFQALVPACLHKRHFENTVEEGEIAHNEKFLFLPPCFVLIW